MTDLFIDKMYQNLPLEIINYIIMKYIYLPRNINIIRKQKENYKRMISQMDFISNILFIDKNCCIYINNNNIIITNNYDNIQLFGTSNYITNIENNASSIYIDENNNNVNNSILDMMFTDNLNNTTISSNYHMYNSNLLQQINSNLNLITQSIDVTGLYYTSNILFNSYTSSYHTSNIILHTNHSDMDNIVFYIAYI
jgi:hypothetical protein